MSASARREASKTIDDSSDKAIKFLQQMIAIPSVTGDEATIRNSCPTI